MLPMNTSHLAGKRCTPCGGGVPPLSVAQAMDLLRLVPRWSLEEGGRRIHRTIPCLDFRSAMKLAIQIGEIAEEEGHHPEITVRWGECVVRIFTIKIDGLHENDFIVAARIDELG